MVETNTADMEQMLLEWVYDELLQSFREHSGLKPYRDIVAASICHQIKKLPSEVKEVLYRRAVQWCTAPVEAPRIALETNFDFLL